MSSVVHVCCFMADEPLNFILNSSLLVIPSSAFCSHTTSCARTLRCKSHLKKKKRDAASCNSLKHIQGHNKGNSKQRPVTLLCSETS